MTDQPASAPDRAESSEDRTSKPRIPESVRQRAAPRSAGAPAAVGGPSPGRILAAAGSVSLGIGLIAVLAGTSQNDVVIEVNPTPVIVQPAPVATGVSENDSAPSGTRDVIVIKGATPADAGVNTTPVARSEGS